MMKKSRTVKSKNQNPRSEKVEKDQQANKVTILRDDIPEKNGRTCQNTSLAHLF